MNRLTATFVVLAAVVLSACAVMPRVSSWDGPPRFTKAEVFNAGLQAGSQSGMQTTASDRESGTMSFTKQIGKGQMILSASVTTKGNIVQVRTTASYGGGLALAGLHEEIIHNFYVFLFRNLNITDPSEEKVNIELLR